MSAAHHNAASSVTIWHLEMRDRNALVRAAPPKVACRIERAEVPVPALNRFFYTAIGGDWHWTDRLTWTQRRWLEHLDRQQVQTWVLSAQGTPAGYFELEHQAGDDVEICYFGLLREFTGRGLGGHLLTAAIDAAWNLGARRVWVHTCSLDHPAALRNYEARGMRLFRTETQLRDVPPRSVGPWPGAGAA